MNGAVEVTAVAQAAATPWWADLLKTTMAAGIGATGMWGAAWVTRRRNPKALQAEISDQIAGAFQKLVDELQEENKRLDAKVDLLREESHGLRNKLAKLQAFAASVFRHIAVLEGQLRSLGQEPAARPDLPDPSTLN